MILAGAERNIACTREMRNEGNATAMEKIKIEERTREGWRTRIKGKVKEKGELDRVWKR